MSREWTETYRRVRNATEALCEALETEDYVVQSMTVASPTKWHLAHTTWFFETFLLRPHLPDYQVLHPQYEYLFNSYYNTVGAQFSRPRRGLLARPTVREVYQYRRYVDERMERLLAKFPAAVDAVVPNLLTVGLNHEQQHQELMLTDLKHVFSVNPLQPAYRSQQESPPCEILASQWRAQAESLYWIGHQGDGFAFDNESPRHQVFLAPFRIASRLVTCGEYLEFMADDGYAKPELWLSDGWDAVRRRGWRAPLYWERRDDAWFQFTLTGLRSVRREEPVCHVSYFEADAYARWAGARLPTEQEWEVTAAPAPVAGNFVEDGRWHPTPLAATIGEMPGQLFGDVWEWTCSPYSSYPGYRQPAGALGEYNAKFMCNQLVLRGGSCATPRDHMRSTYRNFFHPDARWQFTGIRLAKEG